MKSKCGFYLSVWSLIGLLLFGGGCGEFPRERSICEIQGSGPESPYLGQEVITRGLVIADLENVEPGGYLILDGNCPADDDQSRGLYLGFRDEFDLLDEGDQIKVRGIVREIDGETRLEASLLGLEHLSLETQIPDPIDLGEFFIPPLNFGYEKWEGQLVTIPKARVSGGLNSLDRTWIVPQIDLDPSVQLVCFQEESFFLKIRTNLLRISDSFFREGQDLVDLVGLIRQDQEGYFLQLLEKPNSYFHKEIAQSSEGYPVDPVSHFQEASEPQDASTITPSSTPEPTLTLTTKPSPTMIPSPTIYPIGLLLSEVLPDPVGEEPGGEWIEIYNPSRDRLPLDGVKIGDEITAAGKEGMLRFPNGYHINGGEVLVIANQASVFNSEYGFLPDFELEDTEIRVPVLLPYSGWGRSIIKLANSGDEVLLVDPWDRVVDLVVYGETGYGSFAPPVPAPREGHSLERCPPELDKDQAGDWQERISPSPGRLDCTTPTFTVAPVISPTPSPTLVFPHRTITATPIPDPIPTLSMTATQMPQSSASPGPSLNPSLTVTATKTPELAGTRTEVPVMTNPPTIQVTISPTGEDLPTSVGTTDLITASPTGTASSTPFPALTSTQPGTTTSEAINTATPELQIVINEIYPDPDPDLGDSNGDGKISSDDDEFLELVNVSSQEIDLSGWQIYDEVRLRFTFPEGANLGAMCGLVIFGGGDPTGDFGSSLIFTAGSLGLNNNGDQIKLINSVGVEIDVVRYGSEGNQNQSLTRDPDLYGPVPLILHTQVLGASELLYSPGTRADGKIFGGCP